MALEMEMFAHSSIRPLPKGRSFWPSPFALISLQPLVIDGVSAKHNVPTDRNQANKFMRIFLRKTTHLK